MQKFHPFAQSFVMGYHCFHQCQKRLAMNNYWGFYKHQNIATFLFLQRIILEILIHVLVLFWNFFKHGMYVIGLKFEKLSKVVLIQTNLKWQRLIQVCNILSSEIIWKQTTNLQWLIDKSVRTPTFFKYFDRNDSSQSSELQNILHPKNISCSLFLKYIMQPEYFACWNSGHICCFFVFV